MQIFTRRRLAVRDTFPYDFMLQPSWLESAQGKRLFFALRWPRRAFSGRVLQVLCVGALCGLCLAEGVGRWLGLHTPILYEKTSYGYRPQPNQNLKRFGNHVFYDVNGLRSPPPTAEPAPGSRRLLFLGDSIVNGGARVDQSLTIPYLVRDVVTKAVMTTEVLNASSPGWAVANEAAWLNRYGTFNAHHLILVINTFDLFQQAAPSDIVGSHPSFPEQGPGLAVVELVKRYLLPRLLRTADPYDPGAELRDASLATTGAVLGDLRWILLRARHQGAVGIVVLVEPALLLAPDASAMSNEALRQLRLTLAALQVALIETREPLLRAGGAALYRDGVHPTPAGNRIIAQVIAQHLLQLNDIAR